jgi:hypothetical protein
VFINVVVAIVVVVVVVLALFINETCNIDFSPVLCYKVILRSVCEPQVTNIVSVSEV